ncbi:hypothetical protein [Microbacterium paludicola]|uniref:hypothetical protein n=1 Tax=Microbacterium paludicola TaxID=300019 RepID=UPI00119E2041|nr:hypothetical protein [Microbacterium paludicola]
MSTNLAPMVAHSTDPMREATARAAAKAGMTVEAWIAHTDRLEKQHKRFRHIDSTMRRVPTFRDREEAA